MMYEDIEDAKGANRPIHTAIVAITPLLNSDERACPTCGGSGRGKPTLEYPDGEDCPDCAHPKQSQLEEGEANE